jgi:hypothetical protein
VFDTTPLILSENQEVRAVQNMSLLLEELPRGISRAKDRTIQHENLKQRSI